MHIYFPVTGRRGALPDDAHGARGASDAGRLLVLRDPDDESEWQYLGNPEVAATTSLSDVVARFIQDCSGADGLIAPQQVAAAQGVRAALLQAVQQIDAALKKSGA